MSFRLVRFSSPVQALDRFDARESASCAFITAPPCARSVLELEQGPQLNASHELGSSLTATHPFLYLASCRSFKPRSSLVAILASPWPAARNPSGWARSPTTQIPPHPPAERTRMHLSGRHRETPSWFSCQYVFSPSWWLLMAPRLVLPCRSAPPRAHDDGPADKTQTIAEALNGSAIETFWSGTSFLLASTGMPPCQTRSSHSRRQPNIHR